MRRRGAANGGTSKKLATAWLFRRSGGWGRAEYQCHVCKTKRLHVGRVCQKFPELVQVIAATPKEDRRPWAPRFPLESGKRDKSFVVPGYASVECPASAITPESRWLVDLLHAAEVAKESAGASLFGPDLRRWPAWLVDALAVIENVRADVDMARLEALRKNNAGN